MVCARFPTVLLAAFLALAGCEHFDNTRVQVTRHSVGHEIFGVLCDRLVAQNFPEDLENRRFKNTCHKSEFGKFAPVPEVPQYAETAAEDNSRLALARVAVFAQRRDDLIKAFDAMIPDEDQSFIDQLKGLLTAMTPLYDQEIPNATRTIADVLGHLESSPEAVDALARMLNRDGYQPITVGGGLLNVVLNQPSTTAVLDDTFRVFSQPENEKVLTDLFVGLRAAIEEGTGPARAVNAPSAGNKDFLELAANAMLVEDDALFFAGPTLLATRRDRCGTAAVPSLVTPFVDANKDGCADIDRFGNFVDVTGRSIPAPTPFAAYDEASAFKRDEYGRALAANGSPFYRYFDLRKTVLTGLMADAQGLLRPETPVAGDLLTTLAPLFGDRTARVLEVGGYQTSVTVYSTQTSPLRDAARAFEPVMKAAAVNDFAALKALSASLRKNERDSARLMASLLTAKNLANQDKTAKLDPKATFWDDMLEVLAEIADARDASGQPVPLLEEVLASFAHPDVPKLAQAYSGLMQNRDVVDYDPANIGGTPINLSGGALTPHLPVDRNLADVGDNRSIFQRVLQLIHETNGVQACNKEGAKVEVALLSGMTFHACEMFKVPNLAKLYIQAIATGGDRMDELAQTKNKGQFPLGPALWGALTVAAIQLKVNNAEDAYDLLMQTGSGIPGLRWYPTPQALARMLSVRDGNAFLHALSEPAPSMICPLDKSIPASDVRYGSRKCASNADATAFRFQGTLFALEAYDFYAAMRPIVRPFVKYDQEELFLKLLDVVHRHYASPQNTACSTAGEGTSNPLFCTKANVVSYEALLSKIFAPGTDVISALHLATKGLEEQGGAAQLAPLVRAFLSRDLNTDLADRAGNRWSKRNDGTEIPYLTPAMLFAQTMNEIDARRAVDAASLDAYKRGRGALVDRLFAFDRAGDDVSTTRLKNAAAAKLTPALIDAAVESLLQKKDKNELDAWLAGGMVTDLTNVIESPIATALGDLMSVVRKDGAAERNLLSLLASALDPSRPEVFYQTVSVAADALQALFDEQTLRPVLLAAAPALEPSFGAAKMSFELLEATSKLDPEHQITKLLGRLVAPMPGQLRTPLDILGATIVEVHRADATKSDALTDADVRRILSETRDFLSNDQRGLNQLIGIMQKRKYVPANP